MQGRMDSPLTEEGKEQALAHGRALRELGGVDRLIVSPSGRTQETAYILNSFLSADMSFNDVLLERDCGEWGGLTVEEIQERFPQQWRAREMDPFAHRPPQGENVQDLIERVQDLLESLYASPEDVIALVTHGVMSRAILTHFLALTPAESGLVRHPNDLFYALEFSATDIRPCYFRAGDGPFDGLLRSENKATVVRPDALNKKTGRGSDAGTESE